MGAAADFPFRWRHLKLSTLLHEARVGPRVLGITEASEALDGRPAVVEAALRPITRDELEARASEALSLFARLHTNNPLRNALYDTFSESDTEGTRPFERQIREVRERWFEAVTGRWLEAGLSEIGDITAIVGELLNGIEANTGQFVHNLEPVPAHNDPNHGNFMLNRQGALRMIDFENLALNSPVADLGVFLTWYVDRDRHAEMLRSYPMQPPEAILERMQSWVPLRYLAIAAHWAARLTRARDAGAWEHAANSIDEWLRSTSEFIANGAAPAHIDTTLVAVNRSLLAAWPLSLPDSGR
jgi:thiamine kinase-like enzyme